MSFSYPVPETNRHDLKHGNVTHLPPLHRIPGIYKNGAWYKHTTIACRWLSGILPFDTVFIPKPGVDTKKAIRAIGAIVKSPKPDYLHRMAGVAFLLDQWFESIVCEDLIDDNPRNYTQVDKSDEMSVLHDKYSF